MTALQRHWGYRALFYTRIVWILLHLVLLGYMYTGQGWGGWLLLLFGCIAGAVPQLVWLRGGRLKGWVYPVTELAVSGGFLIGSSIVIEEYYSYLAIPAMCAAAHVQTVRLRVPLWIWFSLLPPAAMAIVLPLEAFNMSIIEGFFFFGLGGGIWKIIDTERRMKELLDENERQRLVLEQHAKQVETITLLEERNRLSRELHDTVGHTLTSVIMGLDAVAYLIKEAPEEAVQNVNQLRAVSRKGLEEVRKQIHHIAPSEEGGSLPTQLRRIAGEFAVNTGTVIEFEAVGPEVSVPLPLSLTLVRCLQESLTNAKRHGGANQIHITLEARPDRVTLAVHDDGCGMEQVHYGFGLSVMKERLEAYQGEMQVKSDTNSGTTIFCQLPLKRRRAG